MKFQFVLAACLVAAAFAAPLEKANFVDPDCIEEDMVVEEPSQEIDADFALGLPDLRMDFGNPTGDEECEDDVVPTPAQQQEATEECEEPLETEEPTQPAAAPTEAECEEPLTTEAIPEEAPATTAAECVDEITTQEVVLAPEADECADEGNEVVPELNMRIEPAEVVEDIKMYGEEHMIPEIEECEE